MRPQAELLVYAALRAATSACGLKLLVSAVGAVL
jgi:hypothetical protein